MRQQTVKSKDVATKCIIESHGHPSLIPERCILRRWRERFDIWADFFLWKDAEAQEKEGSFLYEYQMVKDFFF
jgi:hypothetical protein